MIPSPDAPKAVGTDCDALILRHPGHVPGRGCRSRSPEAAPISVQIRRFANAEASMPAFHRHAEEPSGKHAAAFPHP